MKVNIATPPPSARIDYRLTLDHQSKMLILAGVLMALFLSSLDQTIVSTALPRIVADLQGIELLGWVSTAYLPASTAMVPIYGKLSDIVGRKFILLFGIIVFLVGSLLCGIAGSMLQLVIFRAIQGFGAAALTSTAFAIPADLFAPAERARYMGLFGAVFGLASVIGPFLGGLLTDTVGWHWIFFVNLPVGLIALTFIVLRLPRLHSGLRQPIDFAGAALLLVAVLPMLLGLTLDRAQHAWTSPTVLGLFALSAAGLPAFLLVEKRAVAPILPLHLFRNRTFTLVSLIGVAVGATLFAAVFFLSLYLVNVLGVSATEAGTTLIPMTLSLVFGSIAASQLVQRGLKIRTSILVGMTTVVIALWWLTTLTPETGIWWVRLRMMLLGLGLGPALPMLNLALLNAVPREDTGAATASRQFFQQLGQVIGSAVFGAILTTSLTSALTERLAPLRSQLPPALAEQFDPQLLRNGFHAAGGGPSDIGAGFAQPGLADLGQQITAAIKISFTDSVTSIYRVAIGLALAGLVLAWFLPDMPLREQPQRSAGPAE